MSGFAHDIAGGNGNLVVTSLKSPNFVHGSTGWAVNKDGTAEFHSVIIPGGGGITATFAPTAPGSPNTGDLWYNTANGLLLSQWSGSAWVPYSIGTGAIAGNAITAAKLAAGIVYAGIVDATTVNAATFTGSVFQGTNWVENSAGQFLYSGTPASGNLIISIAPAAGTDAFGNSYFAGINIYGPGGSRVYMATSGSVPQVVFTPTNTAHSTAPGVILTNSGNAGASNEYQYTQISSGQSGGSDSHMILGGQSADGSITPYIIVSTVIELGAWQNITPDSGWTTVETAQYRQLPDGNIQLRGQLTRTGTTAGVNVNGSNPLPSAFWPGAARYYRPSDSGLSQGTMQVSTGGVIAMRASGFTATTAILDGIYSL